MHQQMTSDALLGRAIAAHDRLVARLDVSGDPEFDWGPTCTAGRRSLAARATAKPWSCPPEIAARVGELIERASSAEGELALDLAETFAHDVLSIVERRATLFAVRSGGERAIDRSRSASDRPRPRPAPATFIEVGRNGR